MTRRGQAALEFLSTYGFAFLIILVMIGALSYFGVLNPSRFLPERCIVGDEFDCRDFQLQRQSDGSLNVSVVLANNIGNTVDINADPNTGASATSNFANATASTCTNTTDIAGGDTATITCNVPGEFPAEGEKVKVQIDFHYMELGGDFPHPIKGEVFATMQ